MNTLPTAQNPKRQHLISKMLLKNFQDSDGKLLAYIKAERRYFRAVPNNIFVQKHRYTQFGAENDEDRFEVERLLGKIETAAAPIVKRIGQLGKIGLVSHLYEEEREPLIRFLSMFFLRTNYHANEIAPKDRYERDFRARGPRTAEEHGIDKDEWQQFQKDPVFGEKVAEASHDHWARIAAGLPPKIAEQIESFIRDYGLSIGRSKDAAVGFILGDCGGVKVTHPEHPDAFHSWLPVSREAVIGLTSHPDEVTYDNLEGSYVNRINWTTFENSDIVVAQRRSDLDYVVRRWEDSQDRT